MEMYSLYKRVKIPGTNEVVGTGWILRLPDLRDYTEKHPDITEMAKKLGVQPEGEIKGLPSRLI